MLLRPGSARQSDADVSHLPKLRRGVSRKALECTALGSSHERVSTHHRLVPDKQRGRTPIGVRPRLKLGCQAQLDPTALSVLAMLLPALCTFCPCWLACS